MDPRVTKLKEARRAASAVGMANPGGQYNCFLNAVVQSLWHLKSFQAAFSEFPEHTHESDKSSCALCALYFIFQQYQSSDGNHLSTVDLRQALSDAFTRQQEFQEGVMADATECYTSLLELIADLLPSPELKQHIVNEVFDMTLVDRMVCTSCQQTSVTAKSTSNSALLYVSKIVEAAKILGEKPLDELIGATLQEDSMPCPSCHKQAVVRKKLKALPSVYAMSVVWPSSRPQRELLNDFFNTISMQICMDNIIELDSAPGVKAEPTQATSNAAEKFPPSSSSTSAPSVTPETISQPTNGGKKHSRTNSSQSSSSSSSTSAKKAPVKLSSNYRLRGMILYYGKHYTACFYHASIKQWLRFDDAHVDPVGQYWHEVHDWCLQSRLQPSMLFFEREDLASKYYEPVPEDAIPRPLKIRTPSFVASPTGSPEPQSPPPPECPRLEGPVHKKSKNKWQSFWARISDWTLTFYSRPQMSYVLALGRYKTSRLDPPVLSIPIDTIQSVEHDKEPHNFNKLPYYLSIVAKSEGAATSVTYNLFVDNEGPFVQWLSALTQAVDLVKATKPSSMRRSLIYDNELLAQFSTNESNNALNFAPDASAEDLQRIAEMENGSPRDHNSDDETTILPAGPSANRAHPPN